MNRLKEVMREPASFSTTSAHDSMTHGVHEQDGSEDIGKRPAARSPAPSSPRPAARDEELLRLRRVVELQRVELRLRRELHGRLAGALPLAAAAASSEEDE